MVALAKKVISKDSFILVAFITVCLFLAVDAGAHGVTDELSKEIVESPVAVPDLFATVHCALGVDPSKELFDGDRPVPITDRGQPIRRLFS